jgi:hypothetical protein
MSRTLLVGIAQCRDRFPQLFAIEQRKLIEHFGTELRHGIDVVDTPDANGATTFRALLLAVAAVPVVRQSL